MKKLTFIVAGLLFVNSILGQSAQGEDVAAAVKPAVMPDSATMMKNMMDYGTPGDVHKMMAAWDGKWKGTMSSWFAPDMPPVQSTIVTVNKMVMNGLHQENTHTGNIMGQAFTGRGTTSYDNDKKRFTTTWLDNYSSGVMIMEGYWDAATKTMNLKGKSIDPATRTTVEMREVYKVIDDNNHLLEMFTTPEGGKEYKSMEIKFVRVKGN